MSHVRVAHVFPPCRAWLHAGIQPTTLTTVSFALRLTRLIAYSSATAAAFEPSCGKGTTLKCYGHRYSFTPCITTIAQCARFVTSPTHAAT